MLKISRDEAQYLFSHGRGEDIHISSITKNSRGKRYYATQSYATMQMLNKDRELMTKATFEG